MPRYTYIAKSQPDKTAQGKIEADSETEAIKKLTKMGYFPMSVTPELTSLDKKSLFELKRFSYKDTLFFTRQLSTLIDSGVNLMNALIIISNQSSNKYFKAVLNDMTARIKDGSSFSDSLASHPGLFSGLYSSMVRTGEASGNLNETLKRLLGFLEKTEEFKNSLRAALTYPFFVFVVSVLTVFILLIFVIPRITSMFEDMGQVLPLSTRMLIGVSGFLRSYIWLILAIILGAIFFLRRLCCSRQGKISVDGLKLRLLIFGPIVLKTEVSRLTRMLSLLLSSGVPITSSLEISLSILQNQVLKSEIQRFQEKISSGMSLSAAFKSSPFFPEFVTNIIAIGEEAGALEKSLLRIADDYEQDVERALKRFTQLLEPAIILVMGLVVGFIVLSMLLPIFQINLIAR